MKDVIINYDCRMIYIATFWAQSTFADYNHNEIVSNKLLYSDNSIF